MKVLKRHLTQIIFGLALTTGLTCQTRASTVDLWQARNGTMDQPLSPIAWVKGNSSQANSHFVEGYSIPYRLVLSDLSPGAHQVILEWDVRQNDRFAIDYITHYQRLQPHDLFLNHETPEAIDPLEGLSGTFAAPTTHLIPMPEGNNTPIPGQPMLSYAQLSETDRSFTIWNGEITSVSYVSQADLSATAASTRLRVDFESTSATVVLAWGGHIGTQFDWGTGQSAGSINGSPYHMRVISVDGSAGNQDRSLQTLPLVPPPPCEFSGPPSLCFGSTGTFAVHYPSVAPGVSYQWSLANNNSGASIIGPTDGTSVQVHFGTEGTFELQVQVTSAGVSSVCSQVILSGTPVSGSPLADTIACLGSDVTFQTSAQGLGIFTFAWTKDGIPIPGATESSLTLPNVTAGDAGRYCVVISGSCNTDEHCALLTLRELPSIAAPADLTLECPDLPPPADPASVEILSGTEPVLVTHAGDSAVTNDCEVIVTRTYQAVDACGQHASSQQRFRIVDTTPPSISVPETIVVECAGPDGTTATFAVDAADLCHGVADITCVPPSGSVFPPGTTTVICTATDVCGNTAQRSFEVKVIDTTPPQITCRELLVVAEEPPGSGSAPVVFELPQASDICDAALTVECDPPSGSVLPVGDTTITCTATDAAGNQATCSFVVRIVPQTIVADSTADSGPGTIRQALIDANSASGPNRIVFNFSGEPPFVVELDSPLPPITDPVDIDGDSQPGYLEDPVIQIDGQGLPIVPGDPSNPGTAGLTIRASHTLVRGFAFSGFPIGILIEQGTGNIIQGNLLSGGLAVPPADGQPGLQAGLVVRSAENLIGGSDPGAGNVICGGAQYGILLQGPEAQGNVIQGNVIGLTADGLEPKGNQSHGIFLMEGPTGNWIGGLLPNEGNHIAFNGGAGVALANNAGSGNRILGNQIHDQAGLGIDLGEDGATDNDPLDADEGPNHRQNYPVLSYTRTGADGTTVRGSLNSAPTENFRVEIFANEAASDDAPLEGRWFLQATTVTTDAGGHAEFEIILNEAVPFDQRITATATDEGGNTSEFSQSMEVIGPPFIITQPADVMVPLGAEVVFCVEAGGSPPLLYQWRLNGVNIPGATNECLTIDSADGEDGGTYTVVVANELDAVLSDGARLIILFPYLQAGDDFADRTLLTSPSDLVSGNNYNATREPGEPLHAGKPGDTSVWYTWQAPADGIATFATSGSTFDTLLAVYTGNSVDALTPVGGDEDRGGFFTSSVQFNATNGVFYHIAIDGYGGASGEYVFGWNFEASAQALPEIFLQPESVTLAFGASHTFVIAAEVECLDAHHDCRHEDKDYHDNHGHEGEDATPAYQWLFNGDPIPGATLPYLTVSNVTVEMVGTYSILVTQNGRTVESYAANLQINETGNYVQPALAYDKFLDSFFSTNALRLALPLPTSTPDESAIGGAGGSAPAIVRGFSTLQVFSTQGTTTDNNERPICGAIGGTSQRLKFTTEIDGLLQVSTLGSLALDGSPLDTVIGLLDQDGTTGCTTCDACGSFSLSILGHTYRFNCLACNDNASSGVKYSSLSYPVKAGVTYYLAVDVVNRAAGAVQLGFCLQPTLSVSTLMESNGPTGGGTEIMILGDQFNTNATVQFGDQTILPTFQNETQISFPLPAGQGGNIQIRVTSAYCSETQISQPLFFQYSAPVITGVSTSAGPSGGGLEIVLTGQNFGTNATVTVGGHAAIILHQTHNEIRFLLPAGSGEDQIIQVTVEGQSSNAPEPFDYIDPHLTIEMVNDAVRVSWDVRLAGYLLQASDSLTPENWSDAESGSTNPALIPVSQARQFYRLRSATP